MAGILASLSALILISDFSKKLLDPYLPLGVPRYQVKNPIDCDELDAPVNVAQNKTFLFVGRLCREKGIGIFCEAVSIAGVQGVVVGDGPERAQLQEAFPQISWLGWQTPEQVKNTMKAARALVFSSLCYEVQPLTTLEAAALGVPCIVSDACAAQEIVHDEVSGLLFQSGDVADLVRQIQRLNHSPELAAMLGRAVFDAFWAAPPTRLKHADDLISVYKDVLKDIPLGLQSNRG